MRFDIYKSKYFNAVYIVAVLIIIGIWNYLQNYNETMLTFYGFAETKEIEINMDHELEVLMINVVPGQFVKMNEILAEVRNLKTDLSIKSKINRIESLEASENLWIQEQKLKIDQLENEKQNKLKTISLAIEQSRSELDYRKGLWSGLKSTTNGNSDNYNPLILELNKLQLEFENESNLFDMKLANLKQVINLRKTPFSKEIDEIRAEIDYFNNKSERYQIIAPHDGLVGNVHCRAGEFVESFRPLISFYEPNPRQVKAYLSENNILHISLNDKVIVKSIKDENLVMQGLVVGLGSRIVEIPSRMRRIPEIKSYGREVVIEIPKNELLQNEKVMVKLISKK